MSIWSFVSQIANAALGRSNAAAAAVKIGPVNVTWAEVKAAGGALPALARAVEDILKGQGSAADYVLVGDDVLKVAALDPALAAPAAVAAALLPFVVAAIASGAIKPDPNPIHDGQTDDGRGGRRG